MRVPPAVAWRCPIMRGFDTAHWEVFFVKIAHTLSVLVLWDP